MLQLKQSAFPNSRNIASKGFTLIELLVVIAIIAILAAILFPVFARARENARRSSCTSNLKQISLGIIQYTQDFDENFPLAVNGLTGAAGTGTPVGWADSIQPYLKSTQIYQCPSEPNGPEADPLTVGYNDYWYNAVLSSASNTGGSKYIPVSLAAVANPTLTIMNGDGGSSTATSRCDGNASSNSTNRGAPSGGTLTGLVTSGLIVNRHLDGMVLSFADGHVKWFKTNASGFRGNIYKPGTTFDESGNAPTFRVFQ